MKLTELVLNQTEQIEQWLAEDPDQNKCRFEKCPELFDEFLEPFGLTPDKLSARVKRVLILQQCGNLLRQMYNPAFLAACVVRHIAEHLERNRTRMTELLHATGVRLGLVTNGEHWMLVDAPKGETTGYSSWYAALWLEEKITLQAFRSLLSASRFFNVPDDQTLEALLTKSANNQQEVTDQLGYQVRRAVEVLIHEIAKIEHEPEIDADLRKLISEIPEAVLYESGLTVMMRLVFLFCAEERELIPTKPFPVYEQNYSVSTISKQLRELADQHDEALLERRYDAWPRLLSAFRAVYGGLQHDDVHIPAYGGSLFNPDRFPFLEGRQRGTSWRDTEAIPLPVSNRTVLHLLEALQLLQIKMPGGGKAEARRLSLPFCWSPSISRNDFRSGLLRSAKQNSARRKLRSPMSRVRRTRSSSSRSRL